MSTNRRLAPELPFPSYSFVPGKQPHPRSDPAGHSYGVEAEAPSPLDPEHWTQNRTYLHGLDLFNAQYYWEAHEQLESLWIAAGRTGPVATFLKALIKLAAAGVKHLEERTDGVASHACRSAELLRSLAPHVSCSSFLGFTLADLIGLAENICSQGWPVSPPRLLPQLPG